MGVSQGGWGVGTRAADGPTAITPPTDAASYMAALLGEFPVDFVPLGAEMPDVLWTLLDETRSTPQRGKLSPIFFGGVLEPLAGT